MTRAQCRDEGTRCGGRRPLSTVGDGKQAARQAGGQSQATEQEAGGLRGRKASRDVACLGCLTNPRRHGPEAGGRDPGVAGRVRLRPLSVACGRCLLPVSPRVIPLCVCVLISLEDTSHVGSDPARSLALAWPPLGPGLPHLGSGDTVRAWPSRVHYGRRSSGTCICEGRLRKQRGAEPGVSGHRAPDRPRPAPPGAPSGWTLTARVSQAGLIPLTWSSETRELCGAALCG